MANVLEVCMVVCFGLSWPLNITKLWKARTAKGTSVLFYFFIVIGYLFGIASKVAKAYAGVSTPFYVWFFYVLNTLMVATGIVIYYRNALLDKKAQAATL
ncbi:MAG: hypothetical protein Q4E65_05675 [Clostridia bacterium]|nr:hypothetical protein [Clostridia bacterium]